MGLAAFLCSICLLAAGCAARVVTGGAVDLTEMSATMVYAEVFNMVTESDDYLGRTIKVRGPYSPLYYDETGDYYHYVEITDATGCCPQGLEFIWSGEHAYPEDYPPERTDVELTGVWKSYQELGETYYCLTVEDLVVLG
jgi:hypothetical protein